MPRLVPNIARPVLVALNERRLKGERTAALAMEVNLHPAQLQLAFQAAGLRIRRPHHYWTKATTTQAHHEHVLGASVTTVAKRHGMSQSSLTQAFNRFRLPYRVRPGKPIGTANPKRDAEYANEHEHVTHEGVCLLCEQRIAAQA